jgi:hypothetical protein
MKIVTPRGFRINDLAARCGIHLASMYRALNDFDANGIHTCSTDLAIAIHRESCGMGFLIPCWELRPDIWALGQVPPVLADLHAEIALGEAAHAVIPCQESGQAAPSAPVAGSAVDDLKPEEQTHRDPLQKSA